MNWFSTCSELVRNQFVVYQLQEPVQYRLRTGTSSARAKQNNFEFEAIVVIYQMIEMIK
jgi:hypothetical protein